MLNTDMKLARYESFIIDLAGSKSNKESFINPEFLVGAKHVYQFISFVFASLDEQYSKLLPITQDASASATCNKFWSEKEI